MSELRALGLCLECDNAIEMITSDPVCGHLNRHWPACTAGENVFSKEPACSKLTPGSPAKMLPPFKIIALPRV